LDPDHPENGVLIPCRFTSFVNSDRERCGLTGNFDPTDALAG
jgi:hypothetical protein